MDYKVDFTANGVTNITNANGKVIGSFEQASKTVVKTDKSLAAYNAQSMKAAKNANSLGGAIEIMSSNMEHANGLYGKATAGAMSLAGAYKGLTGGVAAFGLVLKKLPKLLNPYIHVIEVMLEKLVELFNWFIDKPDEIEEESKKVEAAAKRLADSVRQLSDALRAGKGLVTVEEAEQQIAQQKAVQQWYDKVASAQKDIGEVTKEIAQKEIELNKAREDAYKSQSYLAARARADVTKTKEDYEKAYNIMYAATGKLEKELYILKNRLEEDRRVVKDFNDEVNKNKLDQFTNALGRLKEIWSKYQDMWSDKDKGKKKKLGIDKDSAYLEELEKKWLQTLKQYQKHSHEELARIAIEEEKEVARKRLKNAEDLQKALYRIEGRGAIEIEMAREQDEKEEQKRIEAMERRIEAMTKKSNKLLEQLNPKDKGNEGEEAQKVSHAYGEDVKRMEEELGRVREMLVEMAKMPTEERARVWEQEKALAEQELKITGDVFYRKMKYERDYAIARKKDNAQRIKEEWDFSDATKAAIKANIQGLNSWQEALNLFDKGCTAVQVLQMTASGIQAGADAVSLNAEALAAFSIGDIGRGIGLEAAATGKIAAVAAYIKGLAELGQNSGKVQEPNTSKSGGSSIGTTYGALTGATEEHQTIDINLLYSWTDSQIANALIRGMNATAKTSGSARIDKRIIQG